MYWPLASSGIRYRTRTRPPSAAETLASSRKVIKAGPSRPVIATSAITRDHSPVFSSARSIWVSGTMRTRHPSESRICLTALPPGAFSSRTRIPTCVRAGVGLVLIKLSIRQDGSDRRRIKRLRRIRQGWSKPYSYPRASRLLTYYIVAAGKNSLQTCGAQKNSVDDWTMRGIASGEKDLKAVARPSRSAARLFRRAQNYAALRTHFVKEKPRRRAHGTSWSTGGRRQISGRDQQQI